MKPERVVEFLACLGVPHANKTKRHGWVISACPLGPWNHEGGKSAPEVFGVKIEEGDPQANCFACGYRGTAGMLVFRLHGLNKIDPRIEPNLKRAQEIVDEAEETQEFDFDTPGIEERMAARKNKLHPFPEWWLDHFPHASAVPASASYLAKRGVDETLAQALDLRFDPIKQRVCFPIRDFNGVLRGLHGRAIDPAADLRYYAYSHVNHVNPIVWLGEAWVNLEKPIVVVEGPFDVASVKRVYGNVVSPLYATPSADKIRRMGDAFEWITLFDRGAGGDQGRERVTRALGHDYVIRHLHPPKGRKDPGEMTVEELLTLLSDLVPLTPLF